MEFISAVYRFLICDVQQKFRLPLPGFPEAVRGTYDDISPNSLAAPGAWSIDI